MNTRKELMLQGREIRQQVALADAIQRRQVLAFERIAVRDFAYMGGRATATNTQCYLSAPNMVTGLEDAAKDALKGTAGSGNDEDSDSNDVE